MFWKKSTLSEIIKLLVNSPIPTVKKGGIPFLVRKNNIINKDTEKV